MSKSSIHHRPSSPTWSRAVALVWSVGLLTVSACELGPKVIGDEPTTGGEDCVDGEIQSNECNNCICEAGAWLCDERDCEYNPCADKACGDACQTCPPDDADCVETQQAKYCDPFGACVGGVASEDECSGSSSANPTGGDDGDGGDDGGQSGPYCEDVPSVIPSLDTPTPAGFTGQELLNSALGQRHYTLVDGDAQGNMIKFSPMSAGVPAKFWIEHTGGELRHVVAEKHPCQGRVCNSIDVICIDRLELDVRVYFGSEDGAFEEAWDAKLVALDPTDPDHHGEDGTLGDGVGAKVQLRLTEPFNGSFQVDDILAPPGATDVKAELSFAARFGLPEPQLELQVQVSWIDGEVAVAGVADVYRFEAIDEG